MLNIERENKACMVSVNFISYVYVIVIFKHVCEVGLYL